MFEKVRSSTPCLGLGHRHPAAAAQYGKTRMISIYLERLVSMCSWNHQKVEHCVVVQPLFSTRHQLKAASWSSILQIGEVSYTMTIEY